MIQDGIPYDEDPIEPWKVVYSPEEHKLEIIFLKGFFDENLFDGVDLKTQREQVLESVEKMMSLMVSSGSFEKMKEILSKEE